MKRNNVIVNTTVRNEILLPYSDMYISFGTF